MRKGYIWLIIAAFLLVAASVGVTVALLVASSNTVVNAFTIGGVSISLEESTGEEYVMTPGVKVQKDPAVTVAANSEDCWLFVKVEKKNDFDAFCDYEIVNGWSALAGYDGIFYRMVKKSLSDQTFSILHDDAVYIKDSLTEEQLNAVTDNPELKITAYAAQKDGVASVADAWAALNQSRGSE